MRVLVTGGAGYVGSVSVERLLAAGHDVVVLDDLTTGHRAAVPGRRLARHRARYGDADAIAAPPRARERIDAILHCAARSLVGESRRDPARYYRDNVAGGIALLEAARPGRRRTDRLLARPPPSTASRTRRRSPRTRRSARSTRTARRSGRSRARSAGTARPTACAACRCATSTSPARPSALGEDHDPETHLIPNVLRAAETGRAAHALRRRLPDPRRHLHPRLHPRRRPRRRPPARRSRRPRPTTRGRTRALVCNLGTGRVQRPRGDRRGGARSSAGRSRTTSGPRRAGDPPVLVAAADRAREVLGWTAAPARRSTR